MMSYRRSLCKSFLAAFHDRTTTNRCDTHQNSWTDPTSRSGPERAHWAAHKPPRNGTPFVSLCLQPAYNQKPRYLPFQQCSFH